MEYFKKGVPYFDREMSWLSFNGRVLQEAADDHVPLINRLHFLAIFSSNLDEFYKVRVAALRHLIRISKKESDITKLKQRLKAINNKALTLQQEFGSIYRQKIIPRLRQNGIYLHDETTLSQSQRQLLLDFYHRLDEGEKGFIENERLYFYRVAGDGEQPGDAVIRLPLEQFRRFQKIENAEPGFHVIMLDDVIRLGLEQEYQGKVSCYAFKLNRDAELYLHEEWAQSVREKIRKSLKKRDTGIPTRFLYDKATPRPVLEKMQFAFSLDVEDMIEGGRYHNFHDFWKFPYPQQPGNLTYPDIPALSYPPFENAGELAKGVRQADQLLHFPYQRYEYIIRFLREAAADPAVRSIKMTLYRAAGRSAVFEALMQAARNGKEVLVFNEVQARFDEENNLSLGEQLEEAGAKVLYSHEGLKVHSKLCLITRQTENGLESQALLSTGNFNEKTAEVYSDLALFTAHPGITQEVKQVFDYLEHPEGTLTFNHLLVAKHNMRQRFYELIDREIAHVKAGRKGLIFCKMNGLQDKGMIRKLYEASRAGVEVRLLVRSICCLVPGKEGFSGNISVKSIVGRFLEHARVFMFHNDGNPAMYAGSADWMARNLKRRVEVVFPIYDSDIFNQIETMMNLQWQDNIKARLIDESQSNPRVPPNPAQPINSQEAFYQYLKKSF